MSTYSYYIASIDYSYGPHSALCKLTWNGLSLTNAGRFDGVSLMPNGTLRLIVQDFFSEQFRVKVHDETIHTLV